ATDLTPAQPVEGRVGRRRVRIVGVVHEELVPAFVAGVTAALNRLVALERFAITEAAEMHLPRLDVFHVVDARLDRSARFEHQRPETALRELLCRPSAAHARAYDDCVVVVRLSHGNAPRAPLRSAGSAS